VMVKKMKKRIIELKAGKLESDSDPKSKKNVTEQA
jgi:hypothetical protein